MSALITVEQQLAHVLDTIVPLAPVEVPLAAAHGRTLAAELRAATDIPVFDNSAMDGFAVRLADVASASAMHPVSLRVVGDVPAGSAEDPPLPVGCAIRIMTGAPVPSDADAIVPIEHTAEYAEGLTAGAPVPTRVTVTSAPKPAAHIRRAGEDLRRGDTVLPSGALLTPRHVAAAAASGAATLLVRPSPRVAVIATGSELVAPGEPLRRGQIPESNSVLLAGLVAESGGTPARVTTVPDDENSLRTELDACLRASADLIVLSGGVSVGAYDVVKAVLQGTIGFVSVAMQPGKPQAFGLLPGGGRDTPVFGLPGNPVSVAVSFEAFVRPALLALQGRDDLVRPTVRAVAAVDWGTPPGRRQYMPIVLEPATDADAPPRARPATRGGSGSHLVGGLAAAEGFAIVPAEVAEVRAGDPLTVMLV